MSKKKIVKKKKTEKVLNIQFKTEDAERLEVYLFDFLEVMRNIPFVSGEDADKFDDLVCAFSDAFNEAEEISVPTKTPRVRRRETVHYLP